MRSRPFIMALIFVAGLVLLDRAIGVVLDRSLERVTTGETIGVLNRALRERNHDVLILGNSRARRHIDPDVIEQTLGLSAYNAGADGQGTQYTRLLARLILARGTTARLLILHVDAKELRRSDEQRLFVFAPYTAEDPVVGEVLRSVSATEAFKLLSRTYRYNSLILPIARNLAFRGEARGDGFSPLEGPFRSGAFEDDGRDLPTTVSGAGLLDPALEDHVRALLRDAKANGVAVALVTSPRLDRNRWLSSYEEAAYERFAEIAEEESTPIVWLDERHHPVFRDSSLYRDNSHLNAAGARLYSGMLSERLRGIIAELAGEGS